MTKLKLIYPGTKETTDCCGQTQSAAHGFIVESRELAEILARQFDELMRPAYSYRLELEPSDGDLVWISEENGREVRFTRDPGVGFWRRFSTWFLSFFAPESLL